MWKTGIKPEKLQRSETDKMWKTKRDEVLNIRGKVFHRENMLICVEMWSIYSHYLQL